MLCYECKEDNIDKNSGKLPSVIDGVMKALSFNKREEIKAWEQEIVPCEHTLSLEQQEGRKIEGKGNNQYLYAMSLVTYSIFRFEPLFHV